MVVDYAGPPEKQDLSAALAAARMALTDATAVRDLYIAADAEWFTMRATVSDLESSVVRLERWEEERLADADKRSGG